MAAIGVLHAVAGVPAVRATAGNPIIQWVRSRYESMRAYVQRLLSIENALGRKDHQPAGGMMRQRLALALLTDFCHDLGLSSAEVRTLISDARTQAEQAVAFLIAQAIREGQPQQAALRRATAL